MSKPAVGIFGLTGCAGDQLVILNCEDRLLDLVALIDVREFLMASSENDTACALDVALVEGAVVSQRDADRLREVRQRAKTWWRWEPVPCGAESRPWTAAPTAGNFSKRYTARRA